MPDLIFIDDDIMTLKIYRMILQKVLPGIPIQTFTNPELGLAYIRSIYAVQGASKAVLFLDINMPVLDGWEVLDIFDRFSEIIKRHIKIFVLSSSIDMRDMLRAEAHLLVSGFIAKPLTMVELKIVLSKYEGIILA